MLIGSSTTVDSLISNSPWTRSGSLCEMVTYENLNTGTPNSCNNQIVKLVTILIFGLLLNFDGHKHNYKACSDDIEKL